MRRRRAAITFLGALALIEASISSITPGIAPGLAPAVAHGGPAEMASQRPASPLDFTLNRIDGQPQPLSEYRGKVVMIVNVASQCGLTPQYAALQALYEEKKDHGFVILAFPANDFGAQEPGSNEEIAEFCSTRFGVTFPVFEKISVKGEEAAPLYRMLAALPDPLGGEPRWNFTKFLVDREGCVTDRFEPRTAPDDPAVRARIDELLMVTP